MLHSPELSKEGTSVSSFLSDLNADQLEAALCQRHCLVVAGPGSGKTKMLAAKAAYLLDKGQTVCAVTFTRDSALELKERILKIAGNEHVGNLLVGTFHSIDMLMAFPKLAKSKMGANILCHSKSNLRSPWTIVREGSRRAAVARAIDESASLGMEIEDATALIESIKAGQESAPVTEKQQRLVDCYQEILARHNVIDFQDILLLTNSGIQNGTISPLRVDHLFLDEYQDTDKPQFEWAMHHARSGACLTAVGDDDQSIYGFRRALGYRGMVDFATNLTATKVVLGINYRSHHEILAPSIKVIEQNVDRMPKLLVAHKGSGGTALWERFGSRMAEATACAETIQSAIVSGITVGVLARTNKRLDEVEAHLRRLQIPYTRSSGESLLKTREMAVLMAALGILVREDARDTDEFLAWCGVPEDDLKMIHKAFSDSVFSQAKSKAQLGKLSITDNTKSLVAKYSAKFSEWRSFVSTGGANSAIDFVAAVVAQHTSDKRSLKLLEILCEIPKISQPTPNSSVENFKHFASRLDSIRDAMSGKEKSNAEVKPVSLMTAHGSKGLEFDMVWIVGAEEDSFPDKDSSMQEERRLFYVALTRARKILWVSCSGKNAQSRFIDESKIIRVPSDHFSNLH